MIGERLDQRQMQDHRDLVRCLRSARTQRLIAALAAWIRQGPWLQRYMRRARGDSAILLRARTRPLARTAGPQGRHLKTLGASRRHRVRIKAKRFRYMLEALKETVARAAGHFHRLHRPAKR